MTVLIAPATLRDVTYVMANLRPQDHHEVFCQFGDDVTAWQVGYGLLMGSEAYAARWIDKAGVEWPAMIFGVSPINTVAYSVWALGTRRAWRVVPDVTRYFLGPLGANLDRRGIRLLEARSIITHTTAHAWMQATGADIVGPPFTYGRNDEQFLLFRWTVERYRDTAAPKG